MIAGACRSGGARARISVLSVWDSIRATTAARVRARACPTRLELMAASETPDPLFEDLIHFIQQTRGLDFRGYKRTSLRRRIGLRMETVGAVDFPAYQAFLEVHPQEFVELLNTVLINVTSFFRDREAWTVLKNDVVPRIIERGQPNDSIRIWSVGCASGEEPYSLAMLFAEALGVHEFCRRVKIYATDLDEAALNSARHAIYSDREVEPLPAEYRERYFEQANGRYIFQRELRKCVIFGRHNVVVDAPISRIDLLVCRNLLIYLEAETQSVVLPRLHYALVDDGFLFLGKAETQLARSKLFRPVETRHRIFSKLPQEWRRSAGGSLIMGLDPRDGGQLQLRMLEAIADSASAAYLVVDVGGLLIFANGAARRLLDIGEADIGRPFQDLPISYRPTELRSRIESVMRDLRPLSVEHQEHHRPPGEPLRLTIELSPMTGRDGQPYACLLAFNDTTRLYQLQQGLEAAQESLETTIEELQSANEELETTNEELQSTNEELETTNEELQSSNEELETMNEELRSTNDALGSANDNMQRQADEAAEYRSHSLSILRSVNTGVVVLNADRRIHSWNRWSENAWGMRAEEVVGQPFLTLDIGLPVNQLAEPIARVLGTGEDQIEQRLQGLDRRGRSVTCRVRLSPLLDDLRDVRGVVLIMEDISEDLGQDESRHIGRVLGESLSEIYLLEPKSFEFRLVNKTSEKKLGYGIDELRAKSLAEFLPGVSLRALQLLVQPLLAGERSEVVVEAMIRGRDGTEHASEICLQYIADEHPQVLLAIVHDLGQRQRMPD
jgi:two-component system CheB/CheR fusion protein